MDKQLDISSTEVFDALQSGNLALVYQYFELGGDASIVDCAGNNLLGLICCQNLPYQGRLSELVPLAHYLVDKKNLSLSSKNKWGHSAVYEAASCGFIEMLELGKKQGICLLDHITVNHFLFYKWPRHPSRYQRACFPKALAILLSEDVDLSHVEDDSSYLTALQIACKEGATNAILQLLAAGADANLYKNEYRQDSTTPITSICNYAFRARGECFEAINALLDAGADPNIFSAGDDAYCSKPALIWAVAYGGNTVKVVKRLLAAGADPYLADCKGLNAFDYAKESKRDDLLKLLGANREP